MPHYSESKDDPSSFDYVTGRPWSDGVEEAEAPPVADREGDGDRHDPRCLSLTDGEFKDICDCKTLRMIDAADAARRGR